MPVRVASLWIPGPLPGLNDLLDAAKGSGGRGMGYASLKRTWGEAVWAYARSAGLHKAGPFAGPVRLRFEWREKDRRRDPDGFSSGGKKVILDGLVQAGVLRGDGWRHVAGWEDCWCVDAAAPGVLVEIREVSP